MSDVKFKCPKCGADEFQLPRSDLRPTDKIACVKCGFADSYEKIVAPQALKLVAEKLKKGLKGLKFGRELAGVCLNLRTVHGECDDAHE